MSGMSPTQSNGQNLQIPVIDLSHATATTADKLVDAVSRYGFVFVKSKGLGFTSEIIDDTFALVSQKPRIFVFIFQIYDIGSHNLHSQNHSSLRPLKRSRPVPFQPMYSYPPYP